MDNKRIHYLFAAASFLVPFIVYFVTMQPTIPFWDCGEFAAAAWALQVPHPPGAPFWGLIGRVGMMIPLLSDPVARYNLLSVLSSALTVLILYLTVVRLIRMWRGEPRSMADVLTHYGGALLAALCYTFTDSFWFNALECEVYAFGSLFVALVPWLTLVWYDHADEEHSEKYLLLIAYIIGLSMGVHQLALLTIFPVFMLVYYRRWKRVTIGGWALMALCAVAAFFISYKIVLSKLVDWMGGTGNSWILSVVLLGALVYGIFWSEKGKKPVWNLALWSAMLIFLGYTTYTMVMVRASQDPPMNQWNVRNFAQISKYINREQYGESSLFPRRKEQSKYEPNTKPTWDNYSSDGEFFWKYQTNHMYLRYFMWNFVGRVSDIQDSGVDWSNTWGIPLLIGLFGMFWHFKRDPKRALSMLAAFIVLGLVTAWYQNQQDSQPRERDYFYVGSFYIFAIWVGIGATGVMEMLRAGASKAVDAVRDGARRDTGDVPVISGESGLGAVGAVFALAVVLVPLNMAVGLAGMAGGKSFDQSSKWGMYSRHDNYIPFEYAYNILQSCDKDAILFTAGDNDTFPLWCIQDVYGIRRDIRIVNLSLGNMGWYIQQLKKDSWGAAPIKLPSFPDNLLRGADDSPQGVRPTSGPAQEVELQVSPATMAKFGAEGAPASMRWTYRGQMESQNGFVFMVADQLVKDIVEHNLDERPIYFASAVPPSYRIGLDSYVVSEGLASRVTPIRQESDRSGFGEPINEALYVKAAYQIPSEPKLTPDRGMINETYRNIAARRSYLDDRYGIQSYFLLYGKLANYYIGRGNNPEAKRALDTLLARVPPTRVKYEANYLQLLAEFYSRLGEKAKAKEIIGYSANPPEIQAGAQPEGGDNIRDMFSMGDLRLRIGDYDSARHIFEALREKVEGGDRVVLDYKIDVVDAHILEEKGDKAGAAAKLAEIDAKYRAQLGQMGFANELDQLQQHRAQLLAGGTGDTAHAQPRSGSK